LSGIAAAQAPLYIGTGFQPIFEANRHILSDPNLIHPGHCAPAAFGLLTAPRSAGAASHGRSSPQYASSSVPVRLTCPDARRPPSRPFIRESMDEPGTAARSG
jgi:hypothetical protein